MARTGQGATIGVCKGRSCDCSAGVSSNWDKPTTSGLRPAHMPVRSSNVNPVLSKFVPLANCGGVKEGTEIVGNCISD